MQRAILVACLPWFLLLVASCLGLLGLARVAGARFDMQRLRQLHACQTGSAQSLSFVFTLPAFLLIVLFIMQLSQLMIGITVVHYAAYAAARAACVWLPANMGTPNEPEDVSTTLPAYTGRNWTIPTVSVQTPIAEWKWRKVHSAAVMACAAISPSRTLYSGNMSSALANEVTTLFRSMSPMTANNPMIPLRVQNKLAYSFRNTFIRIEGVDKDSTQGPTYNPRPGVFDANGNLVRPWSPWEIGWEDPITITVQHNFALLPGPGRFLATRTPAPDGTPDRTSPTINRPQGNTTEPLYTTNLLAQATMTNEGLKSTMHFVQYSDIGTP